MGLKFGRTTWVGSERYMSRLGLVLSPLNTSVVLSSSFPHQVRVGLYSQIFYLNTKDLKIFIGRRYNSSHRVTPPEVEQSRLRVCEVILDNFMNFTFRLQKQTHKVRLSSLPYFYRTRRNTFEAPTLTFTRGCFNCNSHISYWLKGSMESGL